MSFLRDLDNYQLSDAISFHDELNPNLWDDQHLRPEVKEQLLYIAKDFLEELGVNDLDVVDITVSGSNAAYSYTKHSDLDLHILVDLSKLDHDEIYKELFNAKKTIYNDTHNITIHGVPVELYVQDSREPVISLGEYSILHDKWLRIPTKRRANLDQTATKAKYEKLLGIIKRTLKSKNIVQVDRAIKKIRQYRQSGLDKGGEFSPENLAYKILRTQNLITKLYDLRDKLHSEHLTIDEEVNPLTHGRNLSPATEKYINSHKWKLTTVDPTTLDVDSFDDPFNRCIDIDTYHPVNLKDPIIVHDNGINIVDGFHRAYQAQQRGLKQIPAYVPVKQELDEDSNQQTTLKQLYQGWPDRDEMIWDFVSKNDFDTPFTIETINPNKLSLYLLSQYRVEHLDELFDMMDNDQKKIVKRYTKDPNLSNSIIVMSDGIIIDGNHRAIAAVLSKRPIKYIDVAETNSDDDEQLDEAFDQPYQFKWKTVKKDKTQQKRIATAKLDDGSKLEIAFELKNRDFPKQQVCDIAFYRDGTVANTGLGDAQRIFATVMSAIDEFLQYYQPDEVTFSANKDVKQGENAMSRTKLYNRMVQRFAGSHGYTATIKEYKSYTIYFLEKQKQEAPEQTLEEQLQSLLSEASGYIPSETEKNDPRFCKALTVDVHPDTMKKGAKKFGWNISRAGIPPTLQPSGKF
jgi:hypothetical protein